MADQDKNTPGWHDPRLDVYQPKWERVDAVLSTDAMREAAGTYLPQYPAENDDNYKDRLSVSVLFPAYEDTLKGICGMVFRKPLKLSDQVPATTQEMWKDLDLTGTHGDVFAQRLFFQGLHRGAAYVLVDMQARPAELDGQRLDQAQAASLNLRPYAVRYDATNLGQLPRFVAINGKKTLQQIVFRETVEIEDGEFGFEEVERARVWRLPVVRDEVGSWQRAGDVVWQVWEERETGEKTKDGAKKTEWVIISEGQTNLIEIPVAIFNASPDTDDDTRFRGPACDELAHAVIEYFQLKSEQRKVLRRCVPVPYTVNLNEEARKAVETSWGPDSLNHCDADGMIAFAEPQGVSLEARRVTMQDVMQEVHDLGLSLVVEKAATSNTSATKERLDMQTRASRLSEWARALKDCFDTVLYHFAAWQKAAVSGSVELGVKDVDLILTAQDITALNAAVKDGNMSRRTMWATMARGGWLQDDHKTEDEEAQIQKEWAAMPPPPAVVPAQNAQAANAGGI